MMRNLIISLLAGMSLLCSCTEKKKLTGKEVENKLLQENNLLHDITHYDLLRKLCTEINCADSALLSKKIVLSDQYDPSDTNQILLMPFIAGGPAFKSSAYSDIHSRFILVNPGYIREFTSNNTLGDTASFIPVLQLMLLHEVGHFILEKDGAFDSIIANGGLIGQQISNSEPEYLTELKKTELAADSLAISLVKKSLDFRKSSCITNAFNIELIVPGMQFQLAGTRMIENFGSNHIDFLRDPSTTHPNLELRITFMNYFLTESDTLKMLIDNYLYNRTVTPVHRQEYDLRINQQKEKILPNE
jgi:hypothetical protein